MSVRRSLDRILAAAIALALVGCGEDGPTDTARPAGITLDADSLALAAGGEDTLRATVRTAAGDAIAGLRVTWSSSDTRIATVDSGGVVRADSSGTATLTATMDTFSVSIPVRVFQTVARLDWDEAPLQPILVGRTRQLGVMATDATGREVPDVTVSWRSLDTLILKIDASGMAFARNWGYTPVTAAVGEVEFTIGVHTAVSQAAFGFVSMRSASVSEVVTTPSSWFACGIEALAGTAVRCTGGNAEGQFGNGATSSTLEEDWVPAASGHQFTSVGAGRLSACGLKADATIWCWGANRRGSLGQDSALTRSTVPVLVTGGHAWKRLSVGPDYFVCAIATDDVPYCWGSNLYKTLGRATALNYDSIPRAVEGGLKAKAIGTGFEGACLVTLEGAPWCWGTTANQNSSTVTPVAIAGTPPLDSIVDIDGGACGLTSTGAVWCWGINDQGQLGAGPITEGNVWHAPRLVAGLPPLVEIAGRWGAVCGRTAESELWCWGADFTAKGSPLPDGTIVGPPRRFSPPGSGIRDLSIDISHYTCGLSGGELYCWRPAP